MQIRRSINEGLVEMRVMGRLDGYWAPQLATELDEVIREGNSRIRLNLSGLEYLSSAGIQVLVRYHQELGRREGSLEVSRPSDPVRKVLGLSGLNQLLARVESHSRCGGGRALEMAGARFEGSAMSSGISQQCRVRQSAAGVFGHLTCWKETIALGFGAFTQHGATEDFGPFLAVAGAAVCLPSEGNGTPDYMLTSGSFVPDLTVQTSIVCEGAFAGHVDFSGAPVSLGILASAAMAILETDLAALAVVGVCEPDRTVLVVGVATRKTSGLLGSLMQPLTVDQWPAGAFSACIFSPGRDWRHESDVEAAVAALFQDASPERMLTGGATCRMRFRAGSLFASAIGNVMAESCA